MSTSSSMTTMATSAVTNGTSALALGRAARRAPPSRAPGIPVAWVCGRAPLADAPDLGAPRSAPHTRQIAWSGAAVVPQLGHWAIVDLLYFLFVLRELGASSANAVAVGPRQRCGLGNV